VRLRSVLFSLVVLAAAAAQSQATKFVTISGDPLKINIGADASFQIFNSSVPGTGQIYPSVCANTADMGVFAMVDGKLVAPNFTNHACSTATGNLGTYVTWDSTNLSRVTGDGTQSNPFAVTVSASSSAGVLLSMSVTYVNGQNYFRVHNRFASFNGTHQVTAFLGADIFLAASDAGTLFLEPTLNAPGGRDCATPPTYNILLIPITGASRYAGAFYGDIWKQIGQGRLSNEATVTDCIDDGAALEWDDVFASGDSTADISAAVSFGEIPPASAFQPFFVSVNPRSQMAYGGDSVAFDVKTAHSADTGFNGPLSLSVTNLPDGMTASFDPAVIPAPGDGTSKLTIHLDPSVFPQAYENLAVQARNRNSVSSAALRIEAICDPPIILSLPSSQPKTQSVARGSRVTLSVKSEQAGGVHYQWYNGWRGSTFDPIPNSDSASFTTPAIQSSSAYWVRVTNNCGTADSQTAVITPQ
jgi:hypothetical protein